MKSRIILVFAFCLTFAISAQALTLKESIEIALKNYPSVITAQKKVDAADAKLAQARGDFFPTIKLNGDWGQSYTEPQTMDVSLPGFGSGAVSLGTTEVAGVRGWSATLSQPVFVASLFPAVNIAQKGADLAKEELRRTTLETSFNVTQAYFGVLRADKFVDLSQQSMEMAKTHLDRVEVMVSAGVATRADLLRGQVRLANAEVELVKAKNALLIAKNGFNNSLGRSMDEAVDLAEEKIATEVVDLPDYNALLKMALENRPEWKQFILTKQVAEDSVSLAQSAYLPALLLTGQTGDRITEYSSYKSDVNSWSVAGVASWTLFDGLKAQSRVREAAANLEAQKVAEEQVKNGLALEIRNAYYDLKSALETIGSAKKAVESAEENYKVSNLRYGSGVGTNLEVLDAQVSLTSVRINYFQSLFDLEIARARINKVVGLKVF